jgi:hypothetical protein
MWKDNTVWAIEVMTVLKIETWPPLVDIDRQVAWGMKLE